MSIEINNEKYTTFSDYFNDTDKVSEAERAQVEFETELIGKMIELREEQGLSQAELAQLCGLKQPAISRLESMKASPQLDTLFKILAPLGYRLEIVPIAKKDI